MSNLMMNEAGMIVKAAMPTTKEGKPAVNVMSMASHKAFAKVLTKAIYATTPIVKGILLRVGIDAVSKKEYVYGEVFYTKGSNNPNAIALMQVAGELNSTEQPVYQIQHWDKKAKELVNDHTAKCNETVNGKTYIACNSHAIVEYGQMEADIRKINKYASDKTIAMKKEKYVNDIATFGLSLSKVGGTDVVSIAKGNTNGTRLTIVQWSPSNMRNESQVFTPFTEEESFAALDEVSGGVFSEAMKGDVTVGDLIKLSARLGILGAPAVLLGEVANKDFGAVIVLDEIEGTEDYDTETRARLEEVGITNKTIDRNTYDGSVVYGVEMMQKFFANLGRKMSKQQVLKFAPQTRTNVVISKVFGETKTQDNMQYRLQRLIDIYGADKVLYVEPGQDVSGLNKEDYKVIVIGNKNVLGTIMDYNGGKLLKNISLQTIVNGNMSTYLLDIAKCTETETSGQLLNKLLVADKDASIEALMENVAANYNNKLKEMTEGDVNPHTASLAQFIFRYVEGGTNNQAALESYIKEEITRQRALVYNAKIEVKAWFQRALFDDSHFLTAGKTTLLNKNVTTGRLECYSLDIEVMFKDEIAEIEANEALSREEKDAATDRLLTGFAVKYPSPSSDEFALFTYLTADRIKRRLETLVEAGTITQQEADILSDDYSNTSYGLTKIGADNTLKHKLAGMDTDYDGMAVIFEKKLVDILIAKYPTTDGVACIIAG